MPSVEKKNLQVISTAHTRAGITVDMTADATADKTADKTADMTADMTADTTADTAADTAADSTADTTANEKCLAEFKNGTKLFRLTISSWEKSSAC